MNLCLTSHSSSFHPDNHVNGLNGDADGDGLGMNVHTLRAPAATKVQEAYVRTVIDFALMEIAE